MNLLQVPIKKQSILINIFKIGVVMDMVTSTRIIILRIHILFDTSSRKAVGNCHEFIGNCRINRWWQFRDEKKYSRILFRALFYQKKRNITISWNINAQTSYSCCCYCFALFAFIAFIILQFACIWTCLFGRWILLYEIFTLYTYTVIGNKAESILKKLRTEEHEDVKT